MFSRVVSLILTAAIIGCPTWCRVWMCHAGNCCAAQPCTHVECDTAGTGHCCRKQPMRTDEEAPPSRAPCKSPCQGVCGGAVFDQSCQVDRLEHESFLPPSDADISDGSQLAVRQLDALAHQQSSGGGNYGRLLRTLHASLLC